MGSTPTGVPRPSLDSARRQHETGPWGTQPPHHQTGNADTEPDAPASQPPLNARQADAINHAHLTNGATYQISRGAPASPARSAPPISASASRAALPAISRWMNPWTVPAWRRSAQGTPASRSRRA